MNILIIGGGGREHAFAWKLKQSKKVNQLFILPGNAGTASLGTNLPISITHFEAIGRVCLDQNISYVIVGPEEPLVKGIVDFFSEDPKFKNIKLIGPGKEASKLEGSKSFAKAFMARNHIPTASYRHFTISNFDEGVAYIRNHSLPVVLKADGLAAGKGVIICQSHIEALAEFELIIQRAKFGEAGKTVVVEEYLSGIEISVFVLTDGVDFVMLPEAKDYKRAGEGDTGPNTGGMGAISPVPFFDSELKQQITDRIVIPTLKGLQQEKLEYKGFIFFGLMITDKGPYVIEYNCRMGDPETEAVIPRIKNDLMDLFTAVHSGKLSSIHLEKDSRSTGTVVAVSGGYPGVYEKGLPIKGLDELQLEGTLVFHAGTKFENNVPVTSGGRVLAVTSFGNDIQDAVQQSVYAIEQLWFGEMYFRTDIGFEFAEGRVN